MQDFTSLNPLSIQFTNLLLFVSTEGDIKPYADMMFRRWTAMVISNAFVAVDTFFVLR